MILIQSKMFRENSLTDIEHKPRKYKQDPKGKISYDSFVKRLNIGSEYLKRETKSSKDEVKARLELIEKVVEALIEGTSYISEEKVEVQYTPPR